MEHEENSIREIPVEPIRDDQHAKMIAEEFSAKNKGWRWTGQWKNKIPGKMSVIMVIKVPLDTP